MSDYQTKIREIKPEYKQRDKLGRGNRITLKWITVTIQNDYRGGKHTRPDPYEFKFTVGDDGAVTLSTVDRPNNDNGGISASGLVRTLPLAEQAVTNWINEEDPARLALDPLSARIERNDIDAIPEITNEARASEKNE